MPKKTAVRAGAEAAPKAVEESWKEFFERLSSPLTALGLVVAAVSSALAAWDTFKGLFVQRPLAVVGIGLPLSLALTWFAIGAFLGKLVSRRALSWLRVVACAILILGCALALMSPPACILGCGKAQWKPFTIGNLLNSAAAAEAKNLSVIDVEVDETRSTFRLTRDNQSIHGTLDDKVRIGVEFDRSMRSVFESASCRGMDGERPIEDALPVWRSLLEKRGRKDLVAKLANYDGYRELIQSGGEDAFINSRPNQAELLDLNKNMPEWYTLILRWMVECVGVADPVLIWTLKNDTAKDLTLSSISYNKIDVGQVKGAGPDTIEPIDVLPHELFHKTGIEDHPVTPRVKIVAGADATIRIKYRMQSTEPGYTWLVRPTFRTLEGVSAAGPEIKIFNAKGR